MESDRPRRGGLDRREDAARRLRIATTGDIGDIVAAEAPWDIGHDASFIRSRWERGWEYGLLIRDPSSDGGTLDAHARIATLSDHGVAAIRAGEVGAYAHLRAEHFAAVAPPADPRSPPAAPGVYLTMIRRRRDGATGQFWRLVQGIVGAGGAAVFARPTSPHGRRICAERGRAIASNGSEIHELTDS